MNEPLFWIAFIWTWHFAWLALLTYALGKAAHSHSGWPSWPCSGRWMMTALLAAVTLMVGDLARVIWEVVLGDRTGGTVHWDSVIIRALPLPIAPWVFYRQIRRGLANDY